MTTYTAEDFANAGFARHPDGRIAARLDERYTRPWSIGEDDWLTDVAMALNGWVPVREAGENDGRVERLKRHQTEVDTVTIGRQNRRIQELEAQVKTLSAQAAAQPTTLDALRDAWGTAEVADECNEGDILIRLHPEIPTALVQVWRSEMTVPMGSLTRILHRAPKPTRPEDAETLGALIDEWGDLTRGEEPTPLADWLAARGVRASEEGGK